MAACWLLGTAVFCLFALDPVANFPYLPSILSFGYGKEPASRLVADLDDKIMSSALPLITFLVYVAIVVKLAQQVRRGMSMGAYVESQ